MPNFLRYRSRNYKDHNSEESPGWDDLRFPAAAINPPGAVSDPDWDTDKGGWLFDATVAEVLYLIAQLPHTWKEGSFLVPHLHWEKSTSAAGNVLWRFKYQWSVHRKAREAEVVLDKSTPVENFDVLDTQMITSFGEVTAEGKEISAMLLMRLERVGGDAADTYGADARLLEFDIHYQLDSWGSSQQFTK